MQIASFIYNEAFRERIMILPRFIVFVLAALALSGCCMSGSGCYVAKEGPLSAWDGRGTGPDAAAVVEEEQPMTPEQPMAPQSKKKTARTKTGMMTEPGKRTRAEAEQESEQMRAEQDAANQDADARLTKSLTICRDCMPSARDRDGAKTGTVMMR
jgi:hypothetical protein